MALPNRGETVEPVIENRLIPVRSYRTLLDYSDLRRIVERIANR